MISSDATETSANYTVYVDATNGDDTNTGLTSSEPFKTIQKAWDSIPTIVKHKVTIQLADGTYDTNYIPAYAQSHPAILWGKGKITTVRTTAQDSNITGAIVIKGNSASPALVNIQVGETFKYGFYINKGNIGIQDLSFIHNNPTPASSNKSKAFVVAHRTDTYIHMYNVLLDGDDESAARAVDYGIYTESSGQIELSNKVIIRSCEVGAATFTQGDNIVISGNSKVTDCDTGVLANTGNIKLAMTESSESIMIDNCDTVGIKGISANIEVRGSDSTRRAVINDTIDLESTSATLVYTDTKELVKINNGSSIKYDSSNFQKQLNINASTVWLKNANSYISSETANTDVIPLALLYGSQIQYEGTNNIIGSVAGGSRTVSRNPVVLSYTANDQTLATYKYTDIYSVDGGGANRTGCQIDAASVEEGRTIYVTADNDASNNVAFVNGTHMDIATTFTLGNGSGDYTGITLTMHKGKWRISGMGQQRP